YLTVKRLLDAARSDYRPALVELVTYRMDDHTTADDASRYRTKEMVEHWLKKDPIDRLRQYMISQRSWDDKKDADLSAQCNAEVEDIVREYEATPHPHPADMFEHAFAELPAHLREERDEFVRLLGTAVR
ncbi:MAG: thiamine pyrophosphate-dependent enzyme, partial [Pseudomonadota bacterium]